jgi:hypothetical protein
MTGSVRGRSPASHAVENAAARQRCPKGGARSAPHGGRGQWSKRPKLEARRQARPTWGRIAARGSGAAAGPRIHVRRSPRSAPRKRRARESGGSRVLVSRVGCRGRREASSSCDRGEPRGEPRGHEVARRGGIAPRQGEATPRRAKGCEAQARERQVTVQASPSTARSRIESEGRRPGSMRLTRLNRAGADRVLAAAGSRSRDASRVAGGEREGWSPRASTAAATEDVRDRDVGSGSLSRRAQGVLANEGRHVRAIELRPARS